jgi:hypothetical protein
VSNVQERGFELRYFTYRNADKMASNDNSTKVKRDSGKPGHKTATEKLDT